MNDLIHAAQQGDQNAFNVLIGFYRPMAMRVAQQILRTHEGASDAVQEAMIKAWKAMCRFEEGNFRSWFLRIVTNTCYDHLRRQKRRRALSLDELVENSEAENQLGRRDIDERDNPENICIEREGKREVMLEIDNLPAWHRSVVLLVDVQGMDYEEAATYLDVPIGTVKSRLSRGRAALRTQLVHHRDK